MKHFLFTLLLAVTTLGMVAQEAETATEIKLSTDKVKINGKLYLIHIVRQGQTLYSISKAYNVSQIEIAMENPDIYLGLQVDQALKIPLKSDEIISGDEDEDYIYHIVKRKENLTSLTRKYDVSLSEIYAANPGLDKHIRVNQVIMIPKKRLSTIGKAKDETGRFIYHEVKPREGFYSLKRQYGVSEEVVRKLNPEQTADGLKLGSILKIPKDINDTITTTKPISFEVDIIETPEEYHPAVSVICDTFQYNRWRDIFNVAILLPFTEPEKGIVDTTETAVELTPLEIQKKQEEAKKISHHTANFLDFYQGALIAIDSLKTMGISINLTTYDTGKSSKKTKELLLEDGVENANLIIGPAYPECLKLVAEFALENRIPIVSPLSSNNFMLHRNPYLFQINPSFLTQLEEFTSTIDLCNGDNIVLIHEDDSTNASMVNSYKKMVNSRIDECPSSHLIHFKEVKYKAGSATPKIQELIGQSLSLDRKNIILVPSNNEAFVSDLFGNLHTLLTVYKYPISVYGLPRWQRFRNIQVDYFYELNLHLFTPFYVDYKRREVKTFIAKYRDSFRAEPSQFAFQGYDVMFYFLSAMQSYGIDFQFCIHNHKRPLLQSDYTFKQENSLHGYENRLVNIIRYTPDFDIVIENTEMEPKKQFENIRYLNEQPTDRKEAVFIR